MKCTAVNCGDAVTTATTGQSCSAAFTKAADCGLLNWLMPQRNVMCTVALPIQSQQVHQLLNCDVRRSPRCVCACSSACNWRLSHSTHHCPSSQHKTPVRSSSRSTADPLAKTSRPTTKANFLSSMRRRSGSFVCHNSAGCADVHKHTRIHVFVWLEGFSFDDVSLFP